MAKVLLTEIADFKLNNMLHVLNQIMNWHNLLLGEEDWWFLVQVVLRSFIMFFVALVSLRIIGKRGIMQGVFELVAIITLGSAAGDPMFYQKVGLLPAILVFVVNILLYKVVTLLMARNKKLEHLLEGKHHLIIDDGQFKLEIFQKQHITTEEFFSDLRLKNISHLGQISKAYLEATGKLSVFYYPDNQVRFGLPVLPEVYEHQVQKITKEDYYSCAFCGYTTKLDITTKKTCPTCKHHKWVRSSKELRII